LRSLNILKAMANGLSTDYKIKFQIDGTINVLVSDGFLFCYKQVKRLSDITLFSFDNMKTNCTWFGLLEAVSFHCRLNNSQLIIHVPMLSRNI